MNKKFLSVQFVLVSRSFLGFIHFFIHVKEIKEISRRQLRLVSMLTTSNATRIKKQKIWHSRLLLRQQQVNDDFVCTRLLLGQCR
jgi:hypothetical protein